MSEDPLRITRCVCSDVTFAEMKEAADKHGCTTLDELAEHVEFARDCRHCTRYIRKMLETGQTDFNALEGLAGDWSM